MCSTKHKSFRDCTFCFTPVMGFLLLLIVQSQQPNLLVSSSNNSEHRSILAKGTKLGNNIAPIHASAVAASVSSLETHAGGVNVNNMLYLGKHDDHRKTFITLEKSMSNLTRAVGSKAKFFCDILGEPIPELEWYKDTQRISDESKRIRIETGLWGSSLRVDRIEKSDEGTYMCVAKNPSGLINTTGHLTVTEKAKYKNSSKLTKEDEPDFDTAAKTTGVCQEFKSNVCGKYLNGDYVHVTREFQEALLEAQISKLLQLTIKHEKNVIREDCLKHLMEAMCYYNFPVCLPDELQADEELHYQPYYLCRQDCYMVRQNECRETYEYIEKGMQHDVPGLNMNCTRLPSYSSDNPFMCRRIGQPLPSWAKGPFLKTERDPGYWNENAVKPLDTQQQENKREESSTSMKAKTALPNTNEPGSDLVPIFISAAVLVLLVLFFLTIYFMCRKPNVGVNRFQADGSSLLERPTRLGGSGFGRLNMLLPSEPDSSAEVRGQGVGAAFDYVGQKKRRVPGMGSEIKNSLNGRLLANVNDGYTIAYNTTNKKGYTSPDLNNNNGNVNTRDIKLSSQSPVASVPSSAGLLANNNAHHIVNGSVPTYHQYQTPTCMPPAFPPPNAPAPPPPNAHGFQIAPNSLSSAQGSSNGSQGVHSHNEWIGRSGATELGVEPNAQYDVNNITESPTAYTTLRNTSPNIIMSGESLSIPNPCSDASSTELQDVPRINATEYPITLLRFGKQFGQGVFGPVYKAELLPSGVYENGLPVSVIVKTLSASSSTALQNDFCREAGLMAELDHPNVLSLLGVSVQHPPWCMIFEINQYIDLCELLASRRHNLIHIPNVNQAPLSTSEMLHVVAQVASGMEYLSNHRFVHRDLAARNVILLNDSLFCKITDLGLARDCYANDYYRIHPTSLMLPIRWMPLESIIYGNFTVQSDVWAFGVLMWEIWSGGMRPYASYTDSNVLDLIRSRQILDCPSNCPSSVYALMQSCWNQEAENRPSFRDCLIQICQWRNNLNGVNINHCTSSYSTPMESVQFHETSDQSRNEMVQDLTPFAQEKSPTLNGYTTTHLPVEDPEIFNQNGPVWLDYYVSREDGSTQHDWLQQSTTQSSTEAFRHVCQTSPDGSSAHCKLDSSKRMPGTPPVACKDTRMNQNNPGQPSMLGLRLLPNSTTMYIPEPNTVT